MNIPLYSIVLIFYCELDCYGAVFYKEFFAVSNEEKIFRNKRNVVNVISKDFIDEFLKNDQLTIVKGNVSILVENIRRIC